MSTCSPARLVRENSRRRFAVDADRRQMDDAAHSGALASREQSRRARDMNAARGIAGTVLQRAGAIDDRVNALKQ